MARSRLLVSPMVQGAGSKKGSSIEARSVMSGGLQVGEDCHEQCCRVCALLLRTMSHNCDAIYSLIRPSMESFCNCCNVQYGNEPCRGLLQKLQRLQQSRIRDIVACSLGKHWACAGSCFTMVCIATNPSNNCLLVCCHSTVPKLLTRLLGFMCLPG